MHTLLGSHAASGFARGIRSLLFHAHVFLSSSLGPVPDIGCSLVPVIGSERSVTVIGVEEKRRDVIG